MTPRTPVISKHFSPMSADEAVLESSVPNAEALWRALAAARGHRIIDEPNWLSVDAADGIGGTRVILRAPVTGTAQGASLDRLVEGAGRPVVVEDPFATIDLRAHGLARHALSVMGAGPFTPDEIPPDAMPTEDRPGITVRRVDGDEGLLLEADRIVVEGFPLTSYHPYRPGRLLPASLLTMPHILVFVADLGGRSGGTCMTVKDTNGVGGVYWVAVLPEHRRLGMGRALMLAALRELEGLPVVLCATSQGVPLYRKLGFETARESTYWQANRLGLGRP
jgi:ribosomal protein S18 acetylase RimI-like enzyme